MLKRSLMSAVAGIALAIGAFAGMQDPKYSLNPTMAVGAQIMKAERRALESLESVHIRNPERVMRSYPHEVYGGRVVEELKASELDQASEGYDREIINAFIDHE